MARFLFATQPAAGHIAPALPIASQLVAAGHEVVWYTGQGYQSKIEATGARYTPFQEAVDYAAIDMDEALPERSKLKGLALLRYDLIHSFMGQIGPMHRDMQAILRSFPADVVVGDPTVLAVPTLTEAGGPPCATLSVTCLGMASRDVAPFGFGLQPSATFLGRLRNRALLALLRDVLFRSVAKELVRQRHSIGLRPNGFTMFATSPYLIIQPTVEAFEYPRSDMPAQVHFVGALLPDAPAAFTPPAWWPEVQERRRPVVLVTQGTVANDVRELVVPTLAALANEDVLVIAAGVSDPAELGLDSIPANARLAPFVPFKPLLPYVDAYVTNGGYGGVHFALSSGVPIVIGGTTEDKMEVAARVAYSGAGINLKTSTPTPAQLRAALRQVLHDSQFRQHAQRIQTELAQHDAPAEAATLLDRLAATGQPVLRSQAAPRPATELRPVLNR